MGYKLNTITEARKLAAQVEMADGFSLDVGRLGDYVEDHIGAKHACFIRTIKRGVGVIKTRIFKSREDQCDFLRDLLPEVQGGRW